MDYQEQTESINLLYSELLQKVVTAQLPSGRGITFYRRPNNYWYLELVIGKRKSSHYLGKDSDELRQQIEGIKARWQTEKPDIALRQQLVSMLRKGKASAPNAATGRVIEVMEQSGVFLKGGVLVGSHAFSVYANILGVRWNTALTRTHDVDVAYDKTLSVAIGRSPDENLKEKLMDSELKFIEVPGLDSKSPTTSYQVRGKELRVDLLTPLTGKPGKAPVFIKSLNVYAEPIRFIDYLIEDSMQAVVIHNAGILVNVPDPARFAFHKLVIAQRRDKTKILKARKDISQATVLLEILQAQRPGDIQLAWEAAGQMPEKFSAQLSTGLLQLPDALVEELDLS